MNIPIELSKEDAALFASYAEAHAMSISELVRQSVLERIEDEFDLQAYTAAMAEHRANPITYSLEEVERALALQ